MKSFWRAALLTLCLISFGLFTRANAAVFTVTNTNDSGPGSLRQALIQVSGGPDEVDTIAFNIPLPGFQTIKPITPLPAVSNKVIIDGYTQPGSKPNTLAVGNNAQILIELNGSLLPDDSSVVGLLVQGDDVVIRGLAINRFPHDGIRTESVRNVTIEGNFIGTDITGTVGLGEQGNGVAVFEGLDIDIGTPTPAGRNVISGNMFNGIYVEFLSFSTSIRNNYIGTNKSGAASISTMQGGIALSGQGTQIGSSEALGGNLISGNEDGAIVTLTTAAVGNVIQGNFIGTNATGTAAVPNEYGISLGSSNNLVGGGTPGERNLISGNTGAGVGAGATPQGGQVADSNIIQGNYIGTDVTGQLDLGNGGVGVIMQGANLISGNRIAFNRVGVFIINAPPLPPTNTAITGNSIFSNDSMGIDLGTDVFVNNVTPNDLFDNDAGPNGYQNFPVITSAVVANGQTTISGSLNSTFDTSFTIEFFSNDTTEASGFGEGKNFLGSKQVVTDGSTATFSVTFPVALPVGHWVTSTATDPMNNTSEFSQATQVTSGVQAGSLQLSGSTTIGEAAGKVNLTLNRSGGSDGSVSVQYTTSQSSAKAGEDYLHNSGTLTFGPGETSKTIEVSIVNDLTEEPAEVFDVTLSNPGGGATLGQQVNAQVTISDNDLTPNYSVSDISFIEGTAGNMAVFSIVRSHDSAFKHAMNFTTIDGTAKQGPDYQTAQGLLEWQQGQTVKQVMVQIVNDNAPESDKSFTLALSAVAAPPGQTSPQFTKNQATCTIQDDDSSSQATIQFAHSNYLVAEDSTQVIVTVERAGDLSAAATVEFGTADGSATERGEYTTTLGRLRFAAGESQKHFVVLLNEDTYNEPAEELLQIQLSNPSAGITLGAKQSATVKVIDDGPEPSGNANDDADLFVRQHYHDFLNREADQSGLAFWRNEILSCGADTICVAQKRSNVSAAFFLSIEFQETGFLVHRLNKISYDQLPRYRDFVRDTREIGLGVIVGQGQWAQQLQTNKEAFITAWVNRPEFKTKYDVLSNAGYVDTLVVNAGISISGAERQKFIDALDQIQRTRASVLYELSTRADFAQLERNRAFVLMQYFGYLRRNPDDAPDFNMDGYNFWLAKLNQFNGNYQQAEMVKAFLVSGEYRSRFGQP
jgi:hypothetical protein